MHPAAIGLFDTPWCTVVSIIVFAETSAAGWEIDRAAGETDISPQVRKPPAGYMPRAVRRPRARSR